jgi:hypothetical protein
MNFPRLFKEGSPGRWAIEGPVGVVFKYNLYKIFQMELRTTTSPRQAVVLLLQGGEIRAMIKFCSKLF